MQQIADWLKELGMAECSERFAEKHIDIAVLRGLTDQDLKDLGVVSIGHRRPPPTSLSKSQDYAERRQLAGRSFSWRARDYFSSRQQSSVSGVGADGPAPTK